MQIATQKLNLSKSIKTIDSTQANFEDGGVEGELRFQALKPASVLTFRPYDLPAVGQLVPQV